MSQESKRADGRRGKKVLGVGGLVGYKCYEEEVGRRCRDFNWLCFDGGGSYAKEEEEDDIKTLRGG